MAQLNIASLPQESDLTSTDRILMWDATVSSTSNIKYVSVGQLSASVANIATPTVQSNLSGTFITKPVSPTNNNLLSYSTSASAWTAASVAPTNTVATASIQAGAVTSAKIGTGEVANTNVASGIDAAKISSISSSTIPVAAVPNLDAGKITTGTFGNSFIASGIDAGKITTGTLPTAQVPNLSAGKITSGQIAIANGGTGASTALGALTALSGYGGPNDAKPGRRIFIQSADPNTTGYTMVDGDLWFQV